MGAVRKLNKLLVELLAGSSRVGSIAEPVVEGGSPFTSWQDASRTEPSVFCWVHRVAGPV